MLTKILNADWKIKRLKTSEIYPASVPGDITIDLWKAGLYDDPLVSMNYKQCEWVLREDFEYFLTFDLTKEMLFQEKITLNFLGIDTFAEVYLNDTKLFDAQNMFLGYEKDITSLVKESGNRLSVIMRSTINKGESLDTKNYFSCFNPYRIFLRKAQCHFGWDWAPSLPGYGIWQEVVLSAGSASRISHIQPVTKINGDVTFFTTLDIPVEEADKYKLRYIVARKPFGDLSDRPYSFTVPVEGLKNFAGLHISKPQLWWCNGMGKAALYPYRVELIKDGKTVSEKTGEFGIREVEIEERPTAHNKLSFTLKLNKKPVFIKGSNWVPIECFTGIVPDSKYEALIKYAKDANMNMLRVWGGGIYEKDVFYNLCDKLGLMVWQDFMFACADIPEDNADFVENAIADCRYNLLRLRSHPSVVCWCGGNEKTGTYGRMISHGDFFIDHILQGLVYTLDKTRPYFRQSPHGYVDIGNDAFSGETHHSVFGDLLEGSFRSYRKELAKSDISFNSEVAIMGPCVEKSYREFLREDELWPTCPVWDDRYRYNPYAKILRSFVDIQKQYAKEMYGEFKGLGDFIAKSMSIHADSLAMEIEYARSKKWKNSGIMNWMFSDIWPTGTWSIIDYYLRPKQAYYSVARAFAPVLFTFTLRKNGNHMLSCVNDLMNSISANVEYGQKTFDGEILWKKETTISVSQNSVKKIAEISDADIDKRKDSYLYVHAKDNTQSYSNIYFPYLYPDPRFASDYTWEEERKENKIILRLKARTFARQIRIDTDTPNTTYSDNYFDMEAGEEKEVVIFNTDAQTKVCVSDFAKETK